MSVYSSSGTNDLLLTYQHLAAGLGRDPHLCLAATTAWLDPAWMLAEEELDLYEDEASTLSSALHILRGPFPALYVGAIEILRGGGTFADAERLICAEMYNLGFPLDELTWLLYGIPMPAYGATLHEPDFYEVHVEVVPILEMFGVAMGDEIVIPNTAYRAGHYVAEYLMAQPHARYQQLSWLLQWLFSCSGNTLVDANDEELYELQPLAWEPDNLALARAIITEADDIMKQAMAGLEWLHTQPDVFEALLKNAQRVTRWFEKQKGDKHAKPQLRLHWPALGDRLDGETQSVA